MSSEYLSSKKTNCKNCYKCIRSCPVKSISFKDEQAKIISEECILCGKCYVECPQNAKVICQDLDAVQAKIRGGYKIIASVAPSFAANFSGATIDSLKTAMQRLGFFDVQETAQGASIVKKRYEQMIENTEQSLIISSCCPVVNSLISGYYPEALPYLAQVVTPMVAHCNKIKAENPDCLTVFIGPCIAKKKEGKNSANVDYVLTFDELNQWLNLANVTVERAHDENNNSRARLFPVVAGILRSMDRKNTGYSYLTVDGMDNCIHALRDIINTQPKNCFIEMSACSGSCIGGPVMQKNRELPISDFVAVDNYAGSEDFEIEQPAKNEIACEFKNTFVHKGNPGERAIVSILQKFGKKTAEQELNCGCCGYATCRDKAAAVYQGKADINMCLPYLHEKAESFSDTIINNTPNGILVLNQSLEVQQINAAACEIINLDNPQDVIGQQVVTILDPVMFVQAMNGNKTLKNKRVYLAEYRRYVEQTVIYDDNYKIIISILRDITAEETERLQKDGIITGTIDIADKVIKKQMRVVQEIASLLGETAAETKIALTKLKESMQNE